MLQIKPLTFSNKLCKMSDYFATVHGLLVLIFLLFLAPLLTVTLLFTIIIIRLMSTVYLAGLWPQSNSGKQKMANHRGSWAPPLDHRMMQNRSRNQLSTDMWHRPGPGLLWEVLIYVGQIWWLHLTWVDQSIWGRSKLIQALVQLRYRRRRKDTGCHPVCLPASKLTDPEWL